MFGLALAGPGIRLSISAFAVVAALTGTAPAGAVTAAPASQGSQGSQGSTWVEDEVSFQSDGMTVYGTFRHPAASTKPVPAALLIAGSGPTDRNGNDTIYPHLDSLRTIAQWLSDDGVASLRYDKLFSGETGAGPYSGHAADVGVDVFAREAAGALRLLAAQRGVDRRRLTVIGHSEGAFYALLLKTGQAGAVPPIHALALLEPLSRRFLDTIRAQIDKDLEAQQQAGLISAELLAQVEAVMEAAITQLRTSGTVPANLPYGLATIFSPTNAKYLSEIDRWDPADLASDLPAGLPTLMSCSDADIQISCADVDHLRAGALAARVRLDTVRLHGGDHVRKEDASLTAANYDAPLPFSHELRAALRRFVATA